MKPVIAWQKCLGGTGAETFSQILEHPDGGIVVLGATNSNDGDVSGNHGSSDIWVVKLNKDGVIEWQKCLGGSGNEASAKMMLIPDGGVFVYGAINSNNGDGTGNHGGTDGFAARLSGNGTLLWAKCLGGSAFDTFSEAIRTASGNYLLAGITSSNDGDVSGNHGGNDIWLVELTISGSLVWQKCYGGSDTEQLANIERVNNSGYLICGTTNSTNGDVNGYTDGTDAWVVRTNTGGNLVWQKCYDNPTTLNFPYDVGQKILYTGGQYVFVYSHMEEYNYDYSSNKQKLHRTYAADLDPDNGALSGITLLNPNSILITSLETDWFPAKRIRKKKGGGLLLANDTRYCLVRDDYYWGFFLGEDDYYAQSFTKTVNTPGVQAQQLARLFGHCPTGWLPNVTYYGSYKSEDAVSYDENIMLHSGYTNLVTRPAEIKYGGNDAVVGIGLNNISHWGGSGDDRFLELLPSGENFFYAAGFTNSANGHVAGNHGTSDEIWLVKFAFRHVTIKGAVFNDLNGNGIKETNEPLLNNQAVKTEKPGTQMISFTQNGSFTHLADTGTYTTKIQNTYPYATFNPPQKNSALITYNSVDSFGLGIRFIPNIKDLQVYVSALTPLRPGFNATYRLNYKNFGTDSVTDTRVQFVKDPRTGLVSTTMPGYVQNGDTLLWNTGTLQPGYENYIDIIVSVAAPPTVQINDTLSTQAQVLPIAGDTIPADNYMLNRLVVRGSYDPNDKTNQHAGEVSKAYLVNGGYVYYRIRFQNTGTDTAFTVKITDTLSTELDVNKLEMLEASHNYSLTINNRVATWKFNSILLPDSFSNPAASNGYILFRIKPLASSISPGRLYRNSAGIYFDYNEAVRTPVDSLKIENVRKPVMAGLNNRYCKTPGGPYTGKLMNPLPGYTINVWLDNSQPLLYNPADSTFSFNTSTLSAGAHKIKSVYAVPDFGIDSTEHAFLLDEQLVPVIYKNDTVVCADAYVQLYTSMPVSNWLGGPVFNPQSPYGFFATVSSPDTTLLIAVKNNNSCADGRDSVRIIVNRFLQPVILTNDTSVCNTSPPFPLLANSAVTWSGNGVTGNLFNPAVAGVGTHKVYATRDNGLCAPGRDSMFISVGNFAQVVINTPNQTMCSTGSLPLSANISATWSGIGVSGNYFEPFGLPPGTYTIIATHSNAPCTASYDTLYVTTSPPVQVVIQNRDTAICTQSPPISLIANTSVGVSWFGPGVTGNLGANYSFNPATAGPGIHRVVAVWALPGCPPNYDTLYVTVNNYVQAVIATPNQTVCKLSAPISLQANTTVSWSGTGVAGSTFNPATAGVGVHQIIATKTNGVCPDSKDTLTITVDDFVQAVIATPNQTVCKLSAPISLQANTAVTWSGTGVSGASFNPTTAGAGTHQIIATKNNGVCPDSKDTLTITVDDFVQAVISTPNQTICKLSTPISLQA
ncbi:MAG: hypothetical protein JNM68_15740, partial [Dinghuibacter sp.]|nr:hypothetical protein [Dinghuibacter sp.]